ncbi:MAG: hypothetical protein OEY49_15340, partial [Candidatus Heimdallarchaeota archaeon]|nr:hypothetical protein [Candidatus Heimdallarchaeota archaeon]
MDKKIYLLFLLVSTTLFSNVATAVPGDSFSDPITANVGTNNGAISGTESEYFWFSSSGTFTFSLNGPSGTDFDMDIYDGNQNWITDASGITYPDEVTATSTNGFYIEVYRWTGTGSFTLTITAPVSITSLEYFDGFRTGDQFEWVLTNKNLQTNAVESDGDIRVEILTSPVVDNSGTTENLFNSTYTDSTGEVETYVSDFLNELMLPVIVNFNNGTSIVGLENVITKVFEESTTCSANTCTLNYVDVVLKFDELTGVLTHYSEQYTSGGVNYEYIATLSTDLTKYYPAEEEEEEESSFISFNPFFGIFLLVILPILKVLKRK